MSTLLSVNSYHYRRDGSETVYLEHNRLFAEAGWDVVPFAMSSPANLPTPWSRYFPDEMELGGDYSLPQRVARAPRAVYSRPAAQALRALLRDVRPDLAHCHSIYHHLSPSVLDVLRTHEVPVVMTLHDLKIACPAYLMHTAGAVCERCRGGHLVNVLKHRCIRGSVPLSAVAFAEAQLHRTLATYARGVTRFVSPSAFYVRKLVEWGWDPSRFVHIPNAVDVAGLTPHPEPGRAFLYFGRLSAEKGVRTLVRAAAQAGVPLRLAGDGPLRAELTALAASLGADVTFLGRLHGDALWDEVAAARATVLPSEWYENAPMTVLESYALGKPVVAAAVGGLPELVDEATGWLFASGSVDSLGEALARVAALPPGDVRERGRAARERVERHYGTQDYVRRMTGLYEELGVTAVPAERRR